MAQMVSKTTLEAPEVDVLLNPKVAHSIGVQVGSTGVSTKDANGNLVIKAGTPVGGTVSALDVRNTVLTMTNTSATGANAQGVLRHDVVFKNGSTVENGTLVVVGVVDSSKCPTIVAEAKTALTHIVFQNGGSY